MRLHPTIRDEDAARLFHRLPQVFSRESDRQTLAHVLGATLYVPATRPDLVKVLTDRGRDGASSMVICLEDSIADGDVASAIEGLEQALPLLACQGDIPLLFVRVRGVEQIARIVVADRARVLSGFVLPKFDSHTGPDLMDAVSEAAALYDGQLFAMPVMESRQIADPRQRVAELTEIFGQLAKYPGRTLAVRIGATDLAGVHGLRRSRDTTCYDIGIVRDAITDVRAIVGSDNDLVPIVTGCVWEHFVDQHPRIFRTQLRQTVFDERSATRLRGELLSNDLDGLVREVALDKLNGLTGKSVIHPTHVLLVNALLAVTHEEFCDAEVVLASSAGGVSRSEYRNKMNERGPHRGWAAAVLARARGFGVLREEMSWVDLLSALLLDPG